LTLSYVIIVPVFLVGIMTVVQVSIWYLARESVLAAARHGADVARTSQPPPGSGAQAAVSFATSATSTFLSNVRASAKGTNRTTVRIAVSARIPSMVPGLTIRVREVVTAPVERFVALGDPAVPARTGIGRSALTGPVGAAGPAGPAGPVGLAGAVDPAAGWGATGSRPWLVRS
jgi:hypothetical protein